MYVVVMSSGFSGPGQLIVYGPFASAVLARAWIAARTNPFAYTVACVWEPPEPGTGQTLEPVTVTAGEFVVASSTTNLAGVLAVFVYGTWATEAEAEAWVAQQGSPQVYSVLQVQVAA